MQIAETPRPAAALRRLTVTVRRQASAGGGITLRQRCDCAFHVLTRSPISITSDRMLDTSASKADSVWFDLIGSERHRGGMLIPAKEPLSIVPGPSWNCGAA